MPNSLYAKTAGAAGEAPIRHSPKFVIVVSYADIGIAAIPLCSTTGVCCLCPEVWFARVVAIRRDLSQSLRNVENRRKLP